MIAKYSFLIILCIFAIWIISVCTKSIFRIMRGSIFGGIALYAVSHFLPVFAVGINAVTCLLCGILGLPGFFMLFVIKLLL